MKKFLIFLLVASSFFAYSQQTQKQEKRMRVIVRESDDKNSDTISENREVTVIMDDEEGGRIIERKIVNGDTISENIREIAAGDRRIRLKEGGDHPRIMVFKDIDGEGLKELEGLSWNDESGNHFKFNERGPRGPRGFMPMGPEHQKFMREHAKMMGRMDMMGSTTIRGMMVQPNAPFDGKLTIRFQTEEKGDVTIAVMDLQGKEIAKSEIKDFQGHYLGQIDVKKKEKAVYFVRVVQNNDGMVRRIMIN